MLNVLINAYAVSPNWGSEAGMGWNWIINLANHCNLFIITEGEWKDEIEKALTTLPQKGNIHFYYNPVSEDIRKMCWNQGDWRFYLHYAKWQKKTLEIAKGIINSNHIDIIHQLNMVGFREPGYLWKIKNIPMVWGPVGGIANVPLSYLSTESLKSKIFFTLKNTISDLQFRFHPRVRAAVKSSKMIAAMKGVQDAAKKVYVRDIPIINETGTDGSSEVNLDSSSKTRTDQFNILWVGRFIETKRLDIALNAIAIANNPNISLTICGTGKEEFVTKYKKLAKSLNIENQIIWKGKVDHNKIADIMAKSDLFFFTSIVEATSTVVLEAISANLPILSFNTCGFGPLVEKFAGIAIPLSNPTQSAQDFANKLNYLDANRNVLQQISKQEKEQSHKLSWSYKAQQMIEIYQSLLDKNQA